MSFLLTKSRKVLVQTLRFALRIFGVNSHSKNGVSTKNQIKLIFKYKPKKIFEARKYLEFTQAQLGQDLLILLETNYKQNGYFVEFGATDGIQLSNTYLLEKYFDWKGILAEPAKMWQESLQKNRIASISEYAVWRRSGQTLNFEEYEAGELSTIVEFKNLDDNRNLRTGSINYQVQTISLTDLLIEFQAPREIDVISIDTEGSEYEILRDFNFQTYDIHVFIIEHAFSPNQAKIDQLMMRNGYTRIHKKLSKWDGWYIKNRN